MGVALLARLAYLLGGSLLRLAGDGEGAAGHHGEGHLERVKRLCLLDEIRPFTQPGGTGQAQLVDTVAQQTKSPVPATVT